MRHRLLTAAALASSVLPLAACEQAADPGGTAPALASSRVLDVELCDPANGDFRVAGTSPCLQPSGPCAGLIGAYGVGCDATFVSHSRASRKCHGCASKRE